MQLFIDSELENENVTDIEVITCELNLLFGLNNFDLI